MMGRGYSKSDNQNRIMYQSSAKESTTSQVGALAFSATMFLVPTMLVLAATWSIMNVTTIALSLLVGVAVAYSVRIAYQWEKALITRFGKIRRVSGPGLYFVLPIMESVAAKIDHRIRTITFEAEETLSSDLVPINVDTVLFWIVWDAKRACKEVQNFEAIISLSAQTAMRDAIGQISVGEIASRRTFLNEELKRLISEKVDDWGITVVSVEIRDIIIPKELQQVMSKQAQAERERESRLILAEAERDISEIYLDAATVYGQPDKALQLRTMNLVYESVKDSGSVVVVPSAYSEGFSENTAQALGELAK